MRLLSRYVCAYFLRYFCLGLLGCTGLFLIVELFDRMDDFIERQVFWVDAVYYLFLKLPGLVYQIVPAIFLLASVLTFSTLTKHNEITAMRSGGIAPLRLARPIFLLGDEGVFCCLWRRSISSPMPIMRTVFSGTPASGVRQLPCLSVW